MHVAVDETCLDETCDDVLLTANSFKVLVDIEKAAPSTLQGFAKSVTRNDSKSSLDLAVLTDPSLSGLD